MKIKILPILVIFLSCKSYSQLTKGIWLVGGTGTLYSYHGTYVTPTYNNKLKFTEATILTSIGYFVADKIGVGLRPYFSLNKGELRDQSDNVFTTNIKRYGIGPFARYYFLSLEKPFNIVGDISYQFGINDWHGQSGKINTFSAMAGPVIYFNTSIGLEFLIGYTSKREEIKNLYQDNRKGFQVGIGFQIHLEKE